MTHYPAVHFGRVGLPQGNHPLLVGLHFIEGIDQPADGVGGDVALRSRRGLFLAGAEDGVFGRTTAISGALHLTLIMPCEE
jgi:hypothetical protein